VRNGAGIRLFVLHMRRTALLAMSVLGLAVVPATAAEARVGIRVGIGDQQAGMFDQPAFARLKLKRVRYFIPWNAMRNPGLVGAADAFIWRARRAGISVFLHVSTDDLRIKRARLPSVGEYRTQMRRLVRHFRQLRVREFGVWNEANHASQPTYRSPRRAASFFKVMWRVVKGRCRSCAVVALDVLDQPGVTRYMRRFYRALSPRYRRRASLVGIHNYGDVNRRRSTYTRSIIRTSRRYNRRSTFWFTETGGIVKFGRAWPCSQTRARNRLRTMFSLARRFRSSGVRRLYVYNWSGAGCAARFDAGLVNPDGSPRPGYTYLRRAMRNYRR
jgi:Glycosyl hydrolase catalytic core